MYTNIYHFEQNILLRLFLVCIAIFSVSCYSSKNEKSSQMILSDVKFKFKGNPFLFSTFSTQERNYIAFLGKAKIYIYDLDKLNSPDSISLGYDSQIEFNAKNGEINSFCFSGNDSLFVLSDKNLLFFKGKKLNKTIKINDHLDSSYKEIRFSNLDRTPIFFDKRTNQVLGRIYCFTCGQTMRSFYEQDQLAGINIKNGKLTNLKIPFPDMYRIANFGFSNEVAITNYDTISVISFSVDPHFYVLNRITKKIDTIVSKLNNIDAVPLDSVQIKSTEEKIKALTVNPLYTEIKYDRFRGLYYRFFHSNIDLKNADGKYNTFDKKQIILAIYNSQYKEIGNFKLDKNYREAISFVTNKGLYLFYRTENDTHYNMGYFKLLNFSK